MRMGALKKTARPRVRWGRFTNAGALLLLLGGGPPAARAQTIPSPYRFVEERQEVGLLAGYASPETGLFGYGPGPGFWAGARYGLRLGGPFSLEGLVSYLATKRDLVDPGRVEGDRVVGEVDAGIVRLGGRLRFTLTGDRTWHGLSPSVFAGGGIAFDRAGEHPSEEILLPADRFEFKTTFVGSLGGGIAWHVTGRWVLRLDASLILWRLKTPPGYLDPEREFQGVGEKEWVSGPSFSFGLGRRF